jgi:hypothetical protein
LAFLQLGDSDSHSSGADEGWSEGLHGLDRERGLTSLQPRVGTAGIEVTLLLQIVFCPT